MRYEELTDAASAGRKAAEALFDQIKTIDEYGDIADDLREDVEYCIVSREEADALTFYVSMLECATDSGEWIRNIVPYKDRDDA